MSETWWNKENSWSFVFFLPDQSHLGVPSSSCWSRGLFLLFGLLSSPFLLPWVRGSCGLQAGRLQAEHNEQREGRSPSADQAAELCKQPSPSHSAGRCSGGEPINVTWKVPAFSLAFGKLVCVCDKRVRVHVPSKGCPMTVRQRDRGGRWQLLQKQVAGRAKQSGK